MNSARHGWKSCHRCHSENQTFLLCRLCNGAHPNKNTINIYSCKTIRQGNIWATFGSKQFQLCVACMTYICGIICGIYGCEIVALTCTQLANLSSNMIVNWGVGKWIVLRNSSYYMMTSSNGNSFRVTSPLWGESTGRRWIPLTKASDAELLCLLWLRLNKRFSKQPRRRWFETPSRSLWRHCNLKYSGEDLG